MYTARKRRADLLHPMYKTASGFSSRSRFHVLARRLLSIQRQNNFAADVRRGQRKGYENEQLRQIVGDEECGGA